MRPQGFGLVETIVGIGIMLAVFLAIFGLLRASISISTITAHKAAATALLNSQMEYLRSLSYTTLGTVGGIPAGSIPQYATTTVDGTSYNIRTFIVYHDDPADGIGGADQNAVTTDYKKAKVTVIYQTKSTTEELSAVSVFAPPSIETTTGGGTLVIDVDTAFGAPLSGASVHVVNTSTIPPVDLTTFTNNAGLAYLGGAATSSEYQITVTKEGYSTAKTYDRNATNQNPAPGHLTVAGNQTTSSTFAVDLLASVLFRSIFSIVSGSWTDSFADTSKLDQTVAMTVSGGALILVEGAEGYASSGNALSSLIAPTLLSSWGMLSANVSTPSGTSARVRIADQEGTELPDTALSGNSGGFSSFPVDLSSLSRSTYPSITLRAELTTSDASSTPSVLDWTVSYRTGPSPASAVPFTLTGAKTIGSTGSGGAIYKTIVSTATDAAGMKNLVLEWDLYTLSLSGNVISACPSYTVPPDASLDETFVMGTLSAHSLLVIAKNTGGAALPNPLVTLSRPGLSETVSGNACGEAYFGDLAADSDYTLSATSSALVGHVTGLSVSGNTTYDAILD